MFSRFVLFILVALLAVSVAAQRNPAPVFERGADTTQNLPSWLNRHSQRIEWQRKEPTVIYKGSGRQYKARRGDKMAPKMIVDSIKFFDGLAIFTLNTQRARGRSRLVARSEKDIHIESIYNVDVDSTVISRTLDTIRVYSASAANDTRAEIKLMVQ